MVRVRRLSMTASQACALAVASGDFDDSDTSTTSLDLTKALETSVSSGGLTRPGPLTRSAMASESRRVARVMASLTLPVSPAATPLGHMSSATTALMPAPMRTSMKRSSTVLSFGGQLTREKATITKREKAACPMT